MKKDGFYKSVFDVFDNGEVVVYLREDNNPKYQVKIKLPNSRRIRKSTGISNHRDAIRFAEDLYYDLKAKQRNGEAINPVKFSKVFKEWVRYREMRGQDSSYTAEDIRGAEIHLLPSFKDKDIRKIGFDEIIEHFEKRQKEIPAPAVSTLNKDKRWLRHLFLFARNKNLIDTIPEVPAIRVKGRPVSRPNFTRDEYHQLYVFMRKHLKETNHPTVYRSRFYLQQYVLILANCGIRVGEARNLTWSSVFTSHDDEGNELPSFKISGKTGYRDVVCNPRVKDYLRRLKEFRTKELGHEPQKTEPIFCKKDGSEIHTFKKSWIGLMEASGLTYGADKSKRTIYSLRHTYANFRLSSPDRPVSIYTLASQMGTSVKMIEDFYGHLQNTSPEVATELTRGARRSKK